MEDIQKNLCDFLLSLLRMKFRVLKCCNLYNNIRSMTTHAEGQMTTSWREPSGDHKVSSKLLWECNRSHGLASLAIDKY